MILSAHINAALARKTVGLLQQLEIDDGGDNAARHPSLLRIVVVGNEEIRNAVQKAVDPDYATVHYEVSQQDAIELINRGTIPDLIVANHQLEGLRHHLVDVGIDEIVPQCTLSFLHNPTPAVVRKQCRDYLPEYAWAHFVGLLQEMLNKWE